MMSGVFSKGMVLAAAVSVSVVASAAARWPDVISGWRSLSEDAASSSNESAEKPFDSRVSTEVVSAGFDLRSTCRGLVLNLR